ncbi:MAG: hypothetical protein ABI675_28525 [Chitinophagaceae bacterium]
MDNLKKLSLATLVDMLDKQTNDFLKMFKAGASKKEYDTCKETITRLTNEIKKRKEQKNEAPGLDSFISLPDGRED